MVIRRIRVGRRCLGLFTRERASLTGGFIAISEALAVGVPVQTMLLGLEKVVVRNGGATESDQCCGDE